MFKCNECDHYFDRPEIITEKQYSDYGIGGMWITVGVGECCPKCGCEEFAEARDEDDDVTDPDETLGVGLQQAAATADDGTRVA